jgi:hypothetical protein
MDQTANRELFEEGVDIGNRGKSPGEG